MVRLQTITKQIQKIGKQSAGLVFPKSYIFILDWFKLGNEVNIETHKDELGKTYIIIKQSNENEKTE